MKKLFLVIATISLLAASCNKNQQAAVNTNEQPAPTYVYTDQKSGLSIKLPPNWEALEGGIVGATFEINFRDKKYDGSYEWPGLTISDEAAPKGSVMSKIFDAGQVKNSEATIYFSVGNKKVKATCALFAQKVEENDLTLSQCNQAIATLNFTK